MIPGEYWKKNTLGLMTENLRVLTSIDEGYILSLGPSSLWFARSNGLINPLACKKDASYLDKKMFKKYYKKVNNTQIVTTTVIEMDGMLFALSGNPTQGLVYVKPISARDQA